jgi:hypothetical protein
VAVTSPCHAALASVLLRACGFPPRLGAALAIVLEAAAHDLALPRLVTCRTLRRVVGRAAAFAAAKNSEPEAVEALAPELLARAADREVRPWCVSQADADRWRTLVRDAFPARQSLGLQRRPLVALLVAQPANAANQSAARSKGNAFAALKSVPAPIAVGVSADPDAGVAL